MTTKMTTRNRAGNSERTNKQKASLMGTSSRNRSKISRRFAAAFALCSLFSALCVSCEQDPAADNSSNDTTPYTFAPPPAPKLPDASNPVHITDEAGLIAMMNTPASRRAYYELDDDITLTDWTALGSSIAPFMGALDGKDHTITITGSGGLFAYTKNATIWDLNIEGEIAAEGTVVMAGGIAGNAAWTHITNCHSTASVSVTGSGHNTSAGGIVGNMRDRSMVASCTSSGDVTLDCDTAGQSLMVYAGGLVGYSGTGANGEGTSACLIVKSSSSADVTATGGYPYAGGLLGYNYAKAWVAESFSSGTVTAEGENLPYAGGVVGYNSRNAQISDSYSRATVEAAAASKQALAGGVAGANGASGIITRCYATGAVTATIQGDSAADMGGSLGVPEAANAGGIAGASYYEAPEIKNCAALNSSVTAADTGTDGTLNPYRIAGRVDGTLTNNIAYSGMTLTTGETTRTLTEDDKGGSKQDGADTTEKPAQSVFQSTLGWDFTNTWQMDSISGYPIFKQ